jgi:hypothetical protein
MTSQITQAISHGKMTVSDLPCNCVNDEDNDNCQADFPDVHVELNFRIDKIFLEDFKSQLDDLVDRFAV